MGRRKQQQAAPASTSANNPADADDSMDVDVVYVKLKSSDGKHFNFTETEASCSNALKRMLESAQNCTANNQNGNGARADHILLRSIDSKVLSNIQLWCRMHSSSQSSVSGGANMCRNHAENDPVNGIETSPQTRIEDGGHDVGQRRRPADSWDMKHLASLSELDLLKLTNASNFLDIKDLYNSCCKFMALKWEGMKVEEIRRAYNIRDDLTADEYVQIMEENKRIGLNE